mgnify:CR=1 FL=1
MGGYKVDWNSVLLSEGFDIDVTLQENNLTCPFHIDEKPSLGINAEKGVWICRAGCGSGSLVFFLARYLRLTEDQVKSKIHQAGLDSIFDAYDVDALFSDLGVEEPEATKDRLPEVDFTFTPNKVPTWIMDREISLSTFKTFKCGMNGYGDLVIPIYDAHNRPVGWASRRQKAEPKYLYSKGLKASQLLFAEHMITGKRHEKICVTEGMLDAMWLWQHGYQAVAIFGSNLSNVQLERISRLHTTEIVLCLDADKSGRKGIDKAMEVLYNKVMVSYIKFPQSSGYKDVQDIREPNVLKEVIESSSIF